MSARDDDASRAALNNMMADPSFVAGVAFGEALKAAWELSNPDGRRGYKRTSALAAMVAAQIKNELQPLMTSFDRGAEGRAGLHWSEPLKALERIDALCRALVGKS